MQLRQITKLQKIEFVPEEKHSRITQMKTLLIFQLKFKVLGIKLRNS